VRVVALFSGSLSTCASLALFGLLVAWLWQLNEFQKKHGCQMVFRKVLCRSLLQLAISDLFASASYVFAFFVTMYDEEWFCQFQAFLMTLFETASVLWTAAVAGLLWKLSSLSAPQEKWIPEEFQKQSLRVRLAELCCTGAIWGSVLIMVVILLWTGGLGKEDDEWCWIKSTENFEWIQLVCFYVPLVCIMAGCVVLLALSYTNFKKYRQVLSVVLREMDEDFLRNCDQSELEEIEQLTKDFKKSKMLLMCFLISFLLIWVWPVLSRLCVLALGESPLIVLALQSFFAPLQGLTNFFIYGFIYLEFPCCLWRGWTRHHYVDIPTVAI